jgi:DNA-binding MarR family transcriptional regulator
MDDDGVTRLRRVIGKLARQLNSSSTEEGLTPTQASVLGLVVFRGPVSLGELAGLEGLNPTMLSRVVGKLQSMELIRRIPDPSDLRSASVEATVAGAEADQRVKAQRAAVVSQCLALLDAPHETALTTALPALEALANELQRAGQAAAGS